MSLRLGMAGGVLRDQTLCSFSRLSTDISFSDLAVMLNARCRSLEKLIKVAVSELPA